MTTAINKPLTTTSRGSAVYRWFCSIQTRWMRHREMVRTIRVLHAMPDFALRDIGIHRSEIGGVAKLQRLNGRI